MWYNIFSTTLEGVGFEIDPYRRCVSNKIIEGTQFTITWYVYENILSHKKPAVISYIINKVKIYFGDLSIVRGNKHTFLGTKFEIRDSIIHVGMIKQSEEFMKCLERTSSF